MLFTDHPITARSADELGLGAFAERLARVVLEWPAHESLVIGLYGPWGSGKTSALNLLEEQLALPSWKPRALVVRFNPWLYNDAPSLLKSFFATLRAATKKSPLLSPRQKESLATALEAISKFAVPVFGPMAQVFTGGINVVGPAANAAVHATRAYLATGEVGFEAERAAAAKVLTSIAQNESRTRIVMLIDDLDRADRDEVVAMLKTVKLIASLPNITYVLALDQARVRKTLSTGPTPFDEIYLEKIVQVPISLPAPTAATVQDLTMAALKEIIDQAGLTTRMHAESRRRGSDLRKHIFWRVRTLRDRARLANALRVLLLSADRAADVDPYDALLVSFLQAFYPDVADRIRRNKAFLTGEYTSAQIFRRVTMKQEQLKRYQETMFDMVVEGAGTTPPETGQGTLLDAPYQDIELGEVGSSLDEYSKIRVKSVVAALFPHVLSGADVSGQLEIELRRDNRIASPARFDRYFAFGSVAGVPPDSDVSRWIDEADGAIERDAPETAIEWLASADHLSRHIEHLSSSARADVLERILDNATDMPAPKAERLALAVAFGSTGGTVEIERAVAFHRRLLAQVTSGGFVEPEPGRSQMENNRTNLRIETRLHEAFARVIDEASDPLDAVAAAGEHVQLWTRRAHERQLLLAEKGDALTVHGIEAVAEAGLRRIAAVVAAADDIFQLEPSVAGRAIWRWRDILRVRGESYDPIQQFLRTLLLADPHRLPSVLTLFAGWSDWGPSLDMQGYGEIRKAAEEVVGWRFLLRTLVLHRRSSQGDRPEHHHLVDQLVGKIRHHSTARRSNSTPDRSNEIVEADELA